MANARVFELAALPALDAVLVPAGFERGSDDAWRRVEPPAFGCVDVQTRSDGDAFCVNLGVHFEFVPPVGGSGKPDFSKLREPQCALRTRLRQGGSEAWWTSPSDASVAAQLMRTQGLAFIERYRDLAGTLGAVPPEAIDTPEAISLTPGLTDSLRLLLLARVQQRLGNAGAALAIAEIALARKPRVGPRVQLKRLVEELRASSP